MAVICRKPRISCETSVPACKAVCSRREHGARLRYRRPRACPTKADYRENVRRAQARLRSWVPAFAGMTGMICRIELNFDSNQVAL